MKKEMLKKHAPLISIILISLFVRLPLLNASFWLDEAAQAMQSARPWSEQLNIAYDFQPPLLHLITHFFLKLAFAEWWLRLPSLIAGILTVVFTYFIGRDLLKLKYAWLASFVLAIHSFHVFYSQELRPYSLATVWAVISWYFLLKIMKIGKKKHHEWAYLLFYVVSSIAGLYSTYLYPFLLLSQICFILLFKREQFKRLLPSWGIIILFFLPWLPKLYEQFQVASALNQNTQGWQSVVSFGPMKSIGLVIGKFIFGVSDLELNWNYFLISFILGFFAIQILRKIIWKKAVSDGDFLLLLSWVGISLGSAWLVSWYVPLIQPKRVLFLLPALILLLFYLLEKSQLEKAWKQIFIGLVIIIQFFSLVSYWIRPEYQREDWRELITTIEKTFSPASTAVVFGFDEPFAPWKWYQLQPYPIFATGTSTLSDTRSLNDTLHYMLEYEQVLVFDYLRDLTDPDRLIDQWLVQYGYSEVGALVKPQIGFVRIYKKGKDAKVAQDFLSDE